MIKKRMDGVFLKPRRIICGKHTGALEFAD
jgi:hypothetical protein